MVIYFYVIFQLLPLFRKSNHHFLLVLRKERNVTEELVIERRRPKSDKHDDLPEEYKELHPMTEEL